MIICLSSLSWSVATCFDCSGCCGIGLHVYRDQSDFHVERIINEYLLHVQQYQNEIDKLKERLKDGDQAANCSPKAKIK